MMVALGGPLRIPHLLPNGPNFFVAYQWTRNADAANQTGLVPTTDERSGNLAGLLNAQGQPVTIYNPATGLPVTGIIPVSAQATALLNLYPQPLPSLAGNSRYNYQAEVLNDAHVDTLQSRLNKTIGHRDQLYGGFGFRSSRANTTNLFDFVDTTNSLGIDANVNWSHRFHHQIFALLGYHFTRMRTEVQPEFANRKNVSGLAGIGGNDTDPADWGPPGLVFSSIAGLGDANSVQPQSHGRGLTQRDEHAQARREPADRTWRIFCSAFPTPARWPTATPTSTSGSRCTTRSLPTIGGYCRN